jgi:HlyD family secretion protein
MKNSSSSTFTNPLVLSAIGIVALIAVGSIAYYSLESRPPAQVSIPETTTGTTSDQVTATGTVEPAQNPDLAFESGGRVTHVYVAVNDTVKQGETLATLDSSTLEAQRAQAAAAEKAQEAKLASMQAPARDVDVAAKQTAVSQAQLSLNNLYATVIDTLNDAYSKTYSAVHTDTDSLFTNPDSQNPTLNFTVNSSQGSINTINARMAVNTELTTWQNEISALSPNDTAGLENAIAKGVTHLSVVRDYGNTTAQALAAAVATTNFPQSSIDASVTATGAMRDVVSGRISALQSLSQQISTAKLAIQSAQNALNQTLAGSSKEDIEAQQAQVEAAQANVDSIDAQIAKTVITAPFSGTVSSVQVKRGDIVTADETAISLTPQSALQVTAYFSEADIGKIASGQHANVTLDAYGDSKVFSATVLTVEHSPTMQNNVPAYKVTLQLDEVDPSIAPGMTANITIEQ